MLWPPPEIYLAPCFSKFLCVSLCVSPLFPLCPSHPSPPFHFPSPSPPSVLPLERMAPPITKNGVPPVRILRRSVGSMATPINHKGVPPFKDP